MIRTKRRVMLCIWLIAFNVAFIWGNSLLPREISSALSKLIGSLLRPFASGSLNPAEGEGQGILRKIAHFTEFCTLGMLLTWFVCMVRTRKWEHTCLPLAVGILIAAADETIQLFVPGRGPQLRDVGIDALGVLLGVLILTGIALRRNRKKLSAIN